MRAHDRLLAAEMINGALSACAVSSNLLPTYRPLIALMQRASRPAPDSLVPLMPRNKHELKHCWIKAKYY